MTVHSLCLRLLWSFFFLEVGSNVNNFFPCVSGFSARLSLQVRCQACSPFMAPSALHEMCLGSVGFFSLAFLFHLQPELPRTNYSCGVTSRSCCSICLRGQPQCVRVRVCVCIICSKPAGVLCENVCYVRVCVCVCM